MSVIVDSMPNGSMAARLALLSKLEIYSVIFYSQFMAVVARESIWSDSNKENFQPRLQC